MQLIYLKKKKKIVQATAIAYSKKKNRNKKAHMFP